MGKTPFKNISFTLSGLIESIALRQIGLPDLQRPFVWPNKKVRDLFDSMYRGYLRDLEGLSRFEKNLDYRYSAKSCGYCRTVIG